MYETDRKYTRRRVMEAVAFWKRVQAGQKSDFLKYKDKMGIPTMGGFRHTSRDERLKMD